MREIDRKSMRTGKLLSLKMKTLRHFRNTPRARFTLSTFLGLALLFACSFGCAPSASPEESGQNASSASGDIPEITDETINLRINGNRIRKVPEENGAGEPITWGFDEEEPKEIRVVEKQMNGTRATIILDIKTQSAPRSREPRYLAGQIRTEWEIETGWVLRKWEIVNTENISMKYKNLPKPPANNSNR